MKCCIHDTINGEIKGWVEGSPDSMGSWIEPGQSFFEVQEFGDSDQVYVDVATEELIPRPLMGISVGSLQIDADNVDSCNITGIPAGTMAILRGPVEGESEINDGTLEITTDVSGGYMIRLENFPYQVEEMTLVAD